MVGFASALNVPPLIKHPIQIVVETLGEKQNQEILKCPHPNICIPVDGRMDKTTCNKGNTGKNCFKMENKNKQKFA